MRVLSLICACLAGCSFEPLFVGADPRSDAGADASAGADAGSSGAPVPRDAATLVDAAAPLCRPGRYVGAMEGTYRAGAAGVSGVVGPLLEEWANFAIRGVLHVELAANGSETSLDVAASCMRFATVDGGVADNTGGSLSGRFDCGSGQLDAVLRGFYQSASLDTLGTTQTTTFFRGSLRGRAPSGQAFSGAWSVREPAVLLGEAPGGEGTWTAARASDGGLPLDTARCWQGVSFDDSKFGDAGAQ